MPDMEDVKGRLGIRPVLEEKNRRQNNRNRGIEGERERVLKKESESKDFSIYNNAHQLID